MQRPVEKAGVDEYVSDPAHPVHVCGIYHGHNPLSDIWRTHQRRSRLQRHRTCWCMRLEPLSEDVTVAGPVRPKLKVASRAERIRILW